MTTPLKVHGADLSHHNADPDLKKAKKAGLQWLYHKTTEGATVIDKKYVERRRAAAAAGLPFGGYHFARPDANGRDAKAEANFFIKMLSPKAGDMVPVLDFEVSHQSAEAWCKTFMAEVQRLLKVKGLRGKPMHYGPNDFGKDYKYLRWVPRYNDANRPPLVPYDIWQFSNGQLGVPDSFPGLGHVDLNTVRAGVNLSSFRLTKMVETKHGTIRVGHFSMQFTDKPAQRNADAKAIFKRAVNRRYGWITGTEAFETDTKKMLEAAANANGYWFYRPAGTDAWIAVAHWMSATKPSEFYSGPVVKGEAGKHSAKGVVSVTFKNPTYGIISVIACHKLGKPSMQDDPEVLAQNKKLDAAIGAYARKVGAGKALVFYGGDQNENDRTRDTFGGFPFTSAADELGIWPSTGFGPIDVIASWDLDTRVKAVSWNPLDDREFFLNSDHFGCEATYEVQHLS